MPSPSATPSSPRPTRFAETSPLVRRFLLALVATALVAGVAWYVVVPRVWPRLRPGEAYAIDVSNHQTTIDWTQVHADGVGFAYLKASEGRGYVDSDFARNWAESDRAGVRRGAYHFFTLCATGAEQAANFLRVAPPDAGTLPPAVDLELLDDACTERPDPRAVAVQVDDFVGAVERAWQRPVLVYARDSWTSVYPVPQLADHPQWRTSFFIRPHADWGVWQVHYFALVHGIVGRVDLDVIRPGELG